MSAPLQVRCPTCRRTGPWFEGPYGPFCSERCKLVDLGRWLGEKYRICEPLAAEDRTAGPGTAAGPARADAGAASPDDTGEADA